MTDRSVAPSRIRFRIPCGEAALSRLAQDALNVCRAQRFALLHGLPLDEDPPAGGGREFSLWVDDGRLEGVLLALRVEGVLFGGVECGGPSAAEACRWLAAPVAPARHPGRGAT